MWGLAVAIGVLLYCNGQGSMPDLCRLPGGILAKDSNALTAFQIAQKIEPKKKNRLIHDSIVIID